MVATGAHLGVSIWWAESLFAVVGAWAADAPEAAVRIHLAELSRVLGEHATALRAHLPRPAPVDPADWVAPGSEGADDVVAALAAAESSAERLAGLHLSVLPRLSVAWALPARQRADHEGRALTRALRHAAADLAELRTEGEALLHALVSDPDAAEAVGRRVAALERAWVEAGGWSGGREPRLPGAPASG